VTAALCTAFFLSGCAALIYQVLWIREFGLVFGATSPAVAVVLAVFFGGFALGSRLFGRLSLRLRAPLAGYAVLEFSAGAYALLFPWILAAAGQLYSRLYAGGAGSAAITLAVRAAIAVGVLIVPTTLMGGALPLLLKFLVRRIGAVGGRTGLVYGINAVGAACGSFAAGYLLLGWLGAAGTGRVAAGLNIAAGIVAAVCIAAGAGRREDEDRTEGGGSSSSKAQGEGALSREGEAGAASSEESGRCPYFCPYFLVLVTAVVSGFVSIAYEMLWFRYLLLFFHNSITLYTGIITLFVLGIGIGSVVLGARLARAGRPVLQLGLLQFGIGLTTVAALFAASWSFSPLRVVATGGGVILLCALAPFLLPSTVLMGAVFPVITRIITAEAHRVGDRAGTAYALNTGGAIAGSVLSTFVLFPMLGMQTGLYVLFALNALMALLLLKAELRFSLLPAAAPAILAVGLFPLCIESGLVERLPEAVVRQLVPADTKRIDVREGTMGTSWVSVSAERGADLWDNGTMIGKSSVNSFLVQGFIPLLAAGETPSDVLALAFGSGRSSYALSLFPDIRRLDFLDISRPVIELALEHFEENRVWKGDSRVRFIIDDARSYLRYSGATYDLIHIEATPPMYSFHNALLFTREFYADVEKSLDPGGMFAQVLPAGNLGPDEAIGIMKTFSASFEGCALWFNGLDMVMIGSPEAIVPDIRAMYERLRTPAVYRMLKEKSGMREYHSLGRFLSGMLVAGDDFRRAAEGGAVWTDDTAGFAGPAAVDRSVLARRLHDNLTPWDAILGAAPGGDALVKEVPRLNESREYFMIHLYDPGDVLGMFDNYVERFSLDRERDRVMRKTYEKRYGGK
jgi:spermidine synthase